MTRKDLQTSKAEYKKTPEYKNVPDNAGQVPVTNAPVGGQQGDPGFFKKQWDSLPEGAKNTAKVLAGTAGVGGTLYGAHKIHSHIKQRAEEETAARQQRIQEMYARQMGAQY